MNSRNIGAMVSRALLQLRFLDLRHQEIGIESLFDEINRGSYVVDHSHRTSKNRKKEKSYDHCKNFAILSFFIILSIYIFLVAILNAVIFSLSVFLE